MAQTVQIPTARSVSPAQIAVPPMGGLDGVRPAMSAARPQSAVSLSGFTQLPGAAVEVAASPDGTFWVLSTQGIATGDKFIYHYVSGSYVNVPGAALHIAVGPDNTPWVINAAGGIYHLMNGAFTGIAGGASQISVGANNTVYVISNQGVAGPYGRGIYAYANGSWTQLPGAGVTISASLDQGTYTFANIAPGGFYVTNAVGTIFYYNPSLGFAQLPGAAVVLAPTMAGGLFALGDPNAAAHGIYYNDLSTGQWTQQPGAAISISANASNVYAIGAAGGIYTASLPATPSPSPSPSPSPTAVPIAVTPTISGGLGFIVGGAARTFALSETGYGGVFTVSGATSAVTVTCNPVNCTPAVNGAQVTLTISPASRGSGTITVTDANGSAISIPFRVSSQTTTSSVISGTTYIPQSVTVGSDGNLWFQAFATTGQTTTCYQVVRLSTSGSVLGTYDTPTTPAACNSEGATSSIVAGPDQAVWMVSGQGITRVSTAAATLGAVTPYALSVSGAANANPQSIAAGSDGNLWVTETANDQTGYLARITPGASPSTAVTQIPLSGLPTAEALGNIISASDGNLWFVVQSQNGKNNAIGRITPTGNVTLFPLPSEGGAQLTTGPQIVAGPDGNLWFFAGTGSDGSSPLMTYICRLSTTGTFTCQAEPSLILPLGSEHIALTSGPDGALWAACGTSPVDINSALEENALVRFDTAFNTTVYPLPDAVSQNNPQSGDIEPIGLITGPDNNLWYADVVGHTFVRFSP